MDAETSSSKSAEATIRIPFKTADEATIAYRVLTVDKEPRRNFVQKKFSLVDESTLEVRFTADQVKNLRTAITSFFEGLLLCQSTLKAFAPVPSLDTNNARALTSTDTA